MSEQKSPPIPIEELPYEQSLAELETIVTVLESEERPLEQSIALFERGQKLAQHCSGLLDKAELKIQKLSGDEIVDFGT
ncbi:MAG: exodeoxyribonuclease VII small subunit [Anaerolineales bacterium]